MSKKKTPATAASPQQLTPSGRMKNPHTRDIPLRSRANTAEMQAILTNAHVYTAGDISKWLREAAINYKPAAKKLAVVK